MSDARRVRIERLRREAEGYLELKLPDRALATLDRIENPGTFLPNVLYLRGEALRSLDRFTEALEPLEKAAELAPSNVHVWLALGWCYKRTGRLAAAVAGLERALEADPKPEEEALITYNLACYASLEGKKDRALALLAKAFSLDAHYRDLVQAETDFDPLRSDPRFQSLVSINV
jgi:tetratricopeptide (TPR) repeat protein